jgi:hypothetical protein
MAALTPEKVAALVAKIPINPALVAEGPLYNGRLAACERCDALRGGVLCAHCGCFVLFRARSRAQICPHPGGNKWPAG